MGGLQGELLLVVFMDDTGRAEGSPLRVLIVRGSFASLGGAERELLQLIQAASKGWEVGLATLDLPSDARELLGSASVSIHQPNTPISWPTGAFAEVTAKTSRLTQKIWKEVSIPWKSYDAVHLSVCKGTLELLPFIPTGLPVHYHCLEPPRWLYEDVLHRRLDGTPKRPLWLTSALFSRQRKRDQRFVKALLERPHSSISGNSMWIQERLNAVYGLASDPTKTNGQPPDRDAEGRPLEATHLMHVIDAEKWPMNASSEEPAALSSLPPRPSKYVVTIGKISHVKGTWATLHSLASTDLGLVHVGGGSSSDQATLMAEGKRLGVEVVCMPRLSQVALVGLVREAVAMVSHAYGEPFGLTPIEAMAVGVPALMVDEGGFHHTMSPVMSGRLLARDDLSAWHEAYEEAQNPTIRAQWSEKGREYVEKYFTLPVQLEALQCMLES